MTGRQTVKMEKKHFLGSFFIVIHFTIFWSKANLKQKVRVADIRHLSNRFISTNTFFFFYITSSHHCFNRPHVWTDVIVCFVVITSKSGRSCHLVQMRMLISYIDEHRNTAPAERPMHHRHTKNGFVVRYQMICSSLHGHKRFCVTLDKLAQGGVGWHCHF